MRQRNVGLLNSLHLDNLAQFIQLKYYLCRIYYCETCGIKFSARGKLEKHLPREHDGWNSENVGHVIYFFKPFKIFRLTLDENMVWHMILTFQNQLACDSCN